jgi:hypothetical protein
MRRMLYVLLLVAGGCGSSQNAANQLGVGAECTKAADCVVEATCLTAFAGGYCGLAGCQHDTDCPQGSACVTDDNGSNYCFLVCSAKTDCNLHRSTANESDCTSALPFVDGAMSRKVCRPPNSGTMDGSAGG